MYQIIADISDAYDSSFFLFQEIPSIRSGSPSRLSTSFVLPSMTYQLSRLFITREPINSEKDIIGWLERIKKNVVSSENRSLPMGYQFFDD